MASIIRIKRSGSTGSPSTLGLGELAYSYLEGTLTNGGDRIYIGTGGVDGNGDALTIDVIGGKYFTDKLDHAPGTLTANSAILVDSNKKIDELNVDDIKLDGSTISTVNGNQNLILAPNGTGIVVANNGLEVGDLTATRVVFAGSDGRLTDSADFTFDSGDLEVTGSITVDNVTIDGSTISTATGDLVLDADGDIAVSGSKITGLGAPTADADATTKKYVDDEVATAVQTAGDNAFLDIAGDTGSESVSLKDDEIRYLSGTNAGISVDITRGTATEENEVYVTVSLDQDLSTSGTPTFAEIDIDNININGNTISSTNNNGDINLTADGTGVVVASKLEVADLDPNRIVFTGAGGRLLDNAGLAYVPDNSEGTLTIAGSLEVDNIEIDGNVISALNTDGNVVLSPNGTGHVSVDSSQIKGLLAPTAASDAATKEYVDEVAQGLKVRQAAWVLVEDNLAGDFDADGFETGWATITAAANGAFPAVDGESSETLNVAGARILLTAQTNPAHNGLYVVETPGDASTKWVLRRCSSCRTSEQIPGSFVFVQSGTVYGDTGWVATVDDVTTFTVNVDAIQWVQFSGVGTFTAGDGLSLTGTEFSVNVDDSSIEIVGDTLRVKADGVTNAMLANSVIEIAGDTGTANNVALGETFTVSGGTGITTTVSNNQISVAGDDATTTTKGIASFATADFEVASGAVTLKDSVVKSVSTQSGTVTPTSNSFTINGSGAISTSGATNTVTIAVADATDSVKGVASFNTNQFTVTNGAVSADQFTIGSTNLNLGGTTTTLAGLTQLDVDNIRIDGNTISSTNSNGNVVIDPNGNGVVNVSTSRITNVVDPTDAQDAATKSYVDSQVAGSVELDLNADSGTTQSVNLADGDINFVGGTGVSTTVSKSGDTVSVTFDINQAVGTTDDVVFNEITANGDINANGGDIKTDQTTFNLVNDTATTVNFAGDATAVNIGASTSTVTVADDLTVGGDLTVTGDLTVNGTLTTIDTVNIQVEDPLIKLASGNTADSLSIGFYGQYNDGEDDLKSGFFRDHVSGEWFLFRDLDANIQSNVINPAGIALADINVGDVNASTVTADEFVGEIDGGTY